MGRWPVPRWWAVDAVSVWLALSLAVVSLVVRLMLVFLLVFLLAEVRRLVRPAARVTRPACARNWFAWARSESEAMVRGSNR